MRYETVDIKFNDLVNNVKKIFNDTNNITLFKERNIVKIINFHSHKFVVKSFKKPHLLNQVVYNFFRKSKAKRSYQNSLKLLELGVNTPAPIAYIEFSSLLFFKESFYISDFFDYDFEIRAVFKDENFEDRENILKRFVEYSYKLHNKGIYHIDYSPGNILIKKENQNYLFSIIDVNRMKFIDFDVDLRMKSMSKLTFNDNDNEFISQYYSQISGIDASLLKEKFDFYLKEQLKYLQNKKRLKKLKG
jgi:tRNA A-37 threonylcarbamoyl transferase component Bud32